MEKNIIYKCNYGSVNSWMTASHTSHSEIFSGEEDPERPSVGSHVNYMAYASHVTLFIKGLDLRGARGDISTLCTATGSQEGTEP